jgi:hypothetical protein
MSRAGSRWQIWTGLTSRFRTRETTAVRDSDQPPIPHSGNVVSTSGYGTSPIWAAATALTVFILAWFLYHILLAGEPKQVDSDMRSHLSYVRYKDAVTQAHAISYPLFHWTVALVLAFFPNQGWAAVTQSAAIVLALALAFRTWLTYRELRGPMSAAGAALACLMLAVAMALPNWWQRPADFLPPGRINPNVWWQHFPSIFIGIVNPNVWHNPTTIFAAPFAFLLFHQAILYLDTPGTQLAWSVGVTATVCALAKPNYLLAFLPIFGLILAIEAYRAIGSNTVTKRTVLIHAFAAFALPVAALIGQYIYTFNKGDVHQIIFKPWAAWSRFVDSPTEDDVLYQIRPLVLLQRIPFAILLGLVFPCAVAICYPRKALGDRRTLLAWLILAVGVVEYAVLAENGIQIISGNFFWGLVPASYILFVVSCRLVGSQPQSWRTGLCFTVLGLHVACGVICIIRATMDPPNSLLF